MAAYFAGVDLGTTFTAAALVRNGQREMVRLGETDTLIPSVVYLAEDGTMTAGFVAEQQGRAAPERLARNFKRQIGSEAPLMLGGASMPAHLLLGKLLEVAVSRIARHEGGPPQRLAVTHPANWSHYKLDYLRQGIRHYDLGEPELLSEPEAAAIHYGSLERVEPGSLVAVYDLGGGTFDAAVLRKSDPGFEVVGDPHGVERLGGIDFDAVILDHVTRHVDGALAGLDTADPSVAVGMARLLDDCVRAKHLLSSVPEATIHVLVPGVAKQVTITRAEFEQGIRPTLEQTITALRRALADAGVAPGDLSRVLLVGGSSRIPLVAALVRAALGIDVAVDTDPKNAIAKGAALVASDPTLARQRTAPAPVRGADAATAVTLGFADSFTGTQVTVAWDDSSRQVEIAPGVRDGERLTYPGRGEPGTHGGASGDLTVSVSVEPHAEYGRDGDDLLLRHVVSHEDATAGATVDVPGPGGPIRLEVPAGAAPGRTVRVPGAGFARPGEDPGDAVVTLDVASPPAPAPEPGADVEAAAEVTFEESYLGARKTVAWEGASRTVSIPAGVTDGQRLRFEGDGQPGAHGGAAGDLYVTVAVAGHANWRRHGLDLVVKHVLPHDEAIAGGRATVRTPGGDVDVTVPAASSTGDRIRVADHGFPDPATGGRGDLILELDVALPPEPLLPSQGADIEVRRSVTFGEAYRGVTKQVPTALGPRSVSVPAGVADGEQLRLAGKGEPGTGGAPAGDLVVTVDVGEHAEFTRHGDDLLMAHTVTRQQATEGATVEVETPEGRRWLQVPAGTTTGTRLRIPEKGFPRAGTDQRGDVVVTVHVADATSLWTRVRQLPAAAKAGIGAALLLALVLGVAIIAAQPDGDDTANTAPPAETAAVTTAAVETAAVAPGGTLLSDIAARGSIIVGIFDGEPTSLTDFEVELTTIFAGRLFGGTDPEFGIELVPVSAVERFPALVERRVDVLVRQTAATRSRIEDIGVIFTGAYLLEGLVFAGPGITGLEQLQGARIASLAGTTLDAEAEAFLAEADVGATFVPVETFDDVFAAIDDGTADAAAVFYYTTLLTQRPDFEFVWTGRLLEPIAAVAIAGEEAFRDEVDAALQEIVDDGTWLDLHVATFGQAPPYTLEELRTTPPAER